MNWIIIRKQITLNIPVIFQVASLLAAFTHPDHIVCYAPGDSLSCRRDHRIYIVFVIQVR
ncbi:hypothetical protein C5472_06980 [Photorhabdus sp. RW14-46]|nr:hypothetical protein [Photorhabdus sp. RW14-46]